MGIFFAPKRGGKERGGGERVDYLFARQQLRNWTIAFRVMRKRKKEKKETSWEGKKSVVTEEVKTGASNSFFSVSTTDTEKNAE